MAVLAAAALDQTLAGTRYLMAVANHPDRQAAAALFYLIAAGASAGIAIAMYPVLKQVNSTLALGSVVFRAIEAVFYTTAVVAILSVQSLGQQFATTPANARAPIQAMADVLLSLRDDSNIAAIFALTVSALMYYGLFYRSRLIPRWLSGWGVVGMLLLMTACLLALFSDRPVTGYTLFILPIAVQELVLAVWLLVKGFNSVPSAFSASSESSTPPSRSSSNGSQADGGGLIGARPDYENNPR